MTRADYDKFLQMYGIPPSDEKYSEYKKSLTHKLVDTQMSKLMGEVKQPIKKPAYPNMIIGPDEATGNKERMDFYNKQMKEYNLQTRMLKDINQGFKDKLAYYNQQEKIANEKKEKEKRTQTVPVSKDKQEQVNKVNDKLKNLTPQEREMYNTIRKSQEEKIKLYDKRQKLANQHNDSNKPKSQPSNTKIIPVPKIPNTQQHINHNIMSFQEYKDFRFNQGFGVGQSEYKHYLKRFQLNNPTEYLAGQLRVEHNKQGHSSLGKGQSIEQHNEIHSKNFVNHIMGSASIVGQIPNVKNPPQIVIHPFDKPTPANNEHQIATHSLNKQAAKEAGNPNNPPPKVASGVREDNHLNPSGSTSSIMGGASIGSSIGAIVTAGAKGGSASSAMEQPTMDADGIMRFHNQGGVVGTSTI